MQPHAYLPTSVGLETRSCRLLLEHFSGILTEELPTDSNGSCSIHGQAHVRRDEVQCGLCKHTCATAVSRTEPFADLTPIRAVYPHQEAQARLWKTRPIEARAFEQAQRRGSKL